MKDLITIYNKANEPKDYKVLAIIDKEYKYIIYTDIENNAIDKNLYAVKTKSLDSMNETFPISEDEWQMIEKEYQKIISA